MPQYKTAMPHWQEEDAFGVFDYISSAFSIINEIYNTMSRIVILIDTLIAASWR